MALSGKESEIRFSGDDTVELAHDALAARILERASPAARQRLQAQRLLEEGVRQFRQRGKLFDRKDLRFLKPFEELLNLSEEEQLLLTKSRRRITFQTAGIITATLLLVGLSFGWLAQRSATAVKDRLARANALVFPAGFEADKGQLRNALLLAQASWQLNTEAPLPAAQQILVEVFHRGREQTPILIQQHLLNGTPTQAVYARDARRALIHYADSIVGWIDLNTGQEFSLLHAAEVLDIALSPSGNLGLVSVYPDEESNFGELHLYRIEDAKTPPIQQIFTWEDIPLDLQFTTDNAHFWVTWRDSIVYFQIAENGEATALTQVSLPSQVRIGNRLGLLSDGRTLAASATDSTLRRWAPNGDDLTALKHDQAVVDWIETSEGALGTISGGTVRLWNQEGDTLSSFTIDGRPDKRSLRWLGYHSPDSVLYLNWPDGLIRWAPYTRQVDTLYFQQKRINLHYFPYSNQVFDREEGSLFSIGQDGLEKITGPISANQVEEVIPTPDGRSFTLLYEDQVAFWHYDFFPFTSLNAIRELDQQVDVGQLLLLTTEGKVLQSPAEEIAFKPVSFPQPIEKARLMPDASVLALSTNGQLYRADQAGVSAAGLLNAGDRWVFTRFSPEPALLLRNEEEQFQWYDPATEQVLPNPFGQGIGANVTAFDYAKERQLLATGGRTDRRAVIWDLAGTIQADSLMHDLGIWAIGFAPDETFLLTVAGDGHIRTWDLRGNLLQNIAAHQNWIYDAAFSPDGKDLITVSADRTAKHWQLSDRTLLPGRQLSGHQDTVLGATFSPTGDWFLTWDAGGNTLLRDRGDQLLGIFEHPHGSAVLQATFSPHARRIITRHEDGSLLFWLPPWEIINWLEEERHLTTFTPEERQEWGIQN